MPSPTPIKRTGSFRFLAIEGTDIGTNQNWELHGLDDDNYFSVTLPVAIDITGGETTLVVSANYEQILNNIELAQAPLVHGGYGMALVALENMAASVFEFQGTTLSVKNTSSNIEFKIYPNPTSSNSFSVELNDPSFENYSLEIRNMLGQTIFQKNQVSAVEFIDLESISSGVYLVSLKSDSKGITTQKVIID